MRRAKELSAIEVKRLDHPGGERKFIAAVGGVPGLCLQILPSGSKSWILRAVVGDKRRDIGLGSYREVTLSMARDRAREARDMIWRGIDPIEHRKSVRAAMIASQKRGLLFKDAVEKYAAAKLDELVDDKQRTRWRGMLTAHALPHIGDMLVSDITVQDIQRTLAPIWSEKTETARKLRARIEAVLSWAIVAGHRPAPNPAVWRGNLDALMPKPSKVSKAENHPALALTDAAAWFAALRQREGIGSRALEFLTLCASRSGEVRGATWAEIDLEARLWTVPAARMKGDREHRVPLTADAVALLKALPRMAGTDLVFPAVRGGPLSDMTLSALTRRMHEAELAEGRAGWLDARSGRPIVPHGLRSTFRDWAAETGQDRDMAEIALAHTVGSEVERAYRRSDMLERRRELMAAWGRFLRGEVGAKVIKLEGAR